jgi:hypothetical protein
MRCVITADMLAACLYCCCRRYLYDMTSKWLKGQSNYKLDKIYVWNAGMWGWVAGWGHAICTCLGTLLTWQVSWRCTCTCMLTQTY